MADLTITAVTTASAAVVGSVFDLTFSVAGNSGDVTWSIDPALPDGITLNTSTGEISGTPTANGSYSGTLTATDTSSNTGTYAVTFTVTGKPVISTIADQVAYVGTAYTLTPEVSETSGTVTWSVSSGTLPTGLTLDAGTGVISGTPTAPAASTSITLTCADTSSSSTVTFNIVAYAAVTVSGTLPNGEINQAYTFTPTTTGGNGTYTYTATGLVDGLSIDASTGKVSGTPTTATTGTDITITTTDGNGKTGTYTGTLIVYASISISYPDTSGYVGTSMTVTPKISGGSGTYTYSATKMVQGLAIDASTGVISGTPTDAGTQAISVTVTDNLGASVVTTASVTVQIPVTLSGTPATADVNKAYTFTPTISAVASGGTVSVVRTAGTIPDGLTLDASTGVISGTPTAVGSSTFTLKISDGTSSSTTTFTITVAAWIDLAGTPGSAIVGKVYTFAPTVTSGGAGTITYSATGLASWMTLDSTTGTITGTPSAAASTAVVMTATDGKVSSAPTTYTITSANGLSVTGTLGTVAEYADVSYTPTITGVADASALKFTLSTGALPAGLTMNASTGTISGEATVTGSFSVTYSITDGVTSTTWSTDITVITHVVLSVSLPQTAVGAVYSYSMTGSGGNTTAYVYAASGLPDGITLNTSTGVVSGKATTKGSYTVDWSLTDGVSTSSGTGTLVVGDPISITGTAPDAYIGAAYTFTPTIANVYANGTLGVTLTSGTLPDGLTLNVNTGVISGTPTTVGSSTFKLTASDNRTTDVESFTIKVDKAIAVSGTPKEGEVNTAYSFTPTIENAAGTVTATVDKLPAGLSIDATTGVVSGTPTASGTTASVITVTDGHTTATLSVSFKVVAYIEITGTPAARYISKAFSFTPTVTGGETTSYVYSISDLPDSSKFPLSLDTSTGAISGTPAAAGAYSVKYTVSDGIGSATITIDLTVAEFGFTGTAYEGVIGKSYRFIPSLVGGTGTYTVSVSSGTLPTGLSLNAATGVISGTVMAMGSTTVTLSATDSITTLTLQITLTFTDRVVYALAHRPEHYGPDSTYTSWTESDSSETAKLGYITKGTAAGSTLTAQVLDSSGAPGAADNISVAMEGSFNVPVIVAQTRFSNSYLWGGWKYTNVYGWSYARYSAAQIAGYFLLKLSLLDGGALIFRVKDYADDALTSTTADVFALTLDLVSAQGSVVNTGAEFIMSPAFNVVTGQQGAPTYTAPARSTWAITVTGVGTAQSTVQIRSTDLSDVVSVSGIDLSQCASIVGIEIGTMVPVTTNLQLGSPPLVYVYAPATGSWGGDTITQNAKVSGSETVYYTAAASYKLNKTELYEDNISGLATTMAQFTGDVTEFTNTTPNYNDYHGRYAATAGLTDSYTFASRASDVGYEPKAIMLTAYANTDDDDTDATIAGSAVSSDGKNVALGPNDQSVGSDGSALNFILQKDPVTGDLWTDTAVNGNTFGVTRTK